MLPMLLSAILMGCKPDYSNFAALSVEQKDKTVWKLHNNKEWGKPEHKPICQDILRHQGYDYGNAILWTHHAIQLAETQGWVDLKPLVQAIYDQPKDVHVYKMAFDYLRRVNQQPIDPDILQAVAVLENANAWRPRNARISNDQLNQTIQTLALAADQEAVMVYTIQVAIDNRVTKGGSDEGMQAATKVLTKLDQSQLNVWLDRFEQNVRPIYRDDLHELRERLAEFKESANASDKN